jgi:WXG100 family type VII secretion target
MSGGGLGGYNTDVDVMGGAAQKVDAVNQRIQGQLKQLKTQVENTRSEWNGPAAARFTTLMAAWDKDTTQLNNALQEIANRLRGNRTAYAQAEQAIGGSMSKIESRLA